MVRAVDKSSSFTCGANAVGERGTRRRREECSGLRATFRGPAGATKREHAEASALLGEGAAREPRRVLVEHRERRGRIAREERMRAPDRGGLGDELVRGRLLRRRRLRRA